jgi:hypothetical protein
MSTLQKYHGVGGADGAPGLATAAASERSWRRAHFPRPPLLNNGNAFPRAERKADGRIGLPEAEPSRQESPASIRQQPEERGGLLDMVGNSVPMRRIFEPIQVAAPTRSTGLITGESGTGKELVVRALHQLSPRKDGPLVALNCAAIPKDLAESELFGHASGAFISTRTLLRKFSEYELEDPLRPDAPVASAPAH